MKNTKGHASGEQSELRWHWTKNKKARLHPTFQELSRRRSQDVAVKRYGVIREFLVMQRTTKDVRQVTLKAAWQTHLQLGEFQRTKHEYS